METVGLRPKLISFRVTNFQSENKLASSSAEPWTIQLSQTIEVGLATASDAKAPLLAIVKIDFVAKATQETASKQTAEFSAGYEGKFNYPIGAAEADILPLFENEDYQHGLAAQVFPLAMTHFRREMQSTGFDARNLPLGL